MQKLEIEPVTLLADCRVKHGNDINAHYLCLCVVISDCVSGFWRAKTLQARSAEAFLRDGIRREQPLIWCTYMQLEHYAVGYFLHELKVNVFQFKTALCKEEFNQRIL